MNNLTFGKFARLAPVLKVRTLLRKRAAGELCGDALSAPKVLCIADTLALGWLDEEVKLRRQASGFLASAEEHVEQAVESARALLADHGAAASERALGLFTLLESIRTDVREASVRVALGCVTLCVLGAALTGGDVARRSPTRRGGRRDTELVTLLDGETDGGAC